MARLADRGRLVWAADVVCGALALAGPAVAAVVSAVVSVWSLSGAYALARTARLYAALALVDRAGEGLAEGVTAVDIRPWWSAIPNPFEDSEYDNYESEGE